MAKKDQPQQGVAEQLQPLVDDDAFLTTLSEGTDPSDGGDELAGLLLELRGDVEKQMPPAPLIEGAEEEPEVISLGAARRRRSKPFMHGLIGAAAATLLIAGTGAVVVNAGSAVSTACCRSATCARCLARTVPRAAHPSAAWSSPRRRNSPPNLCASASTGWPPSPRMWVFTM